MLLKVDRMQYGIGQGGFHAQQIRLTDLPEGVTVEPYRFVYDCGSDTGSSTSKQKKPLHWAIEHFAENDNPQSIDKITVNTLYLSHFQNDHINGVKRLAELVNLKEIVIPHLSKKQLAHLLAQQIVSGQLVELTVETNTYLEILERAAGDGPILDGVSTIRIDPNADSPNDENPEATNNETSDLNAGKYTLDHNQQTTTWTHARSRLLHVMGPNNLGVATDLWELRVWSYAQSQSLTVAVNTELAKLKNNGNTALTNTLAGKIDLNELAWAINNRRQIQTAYEAALKSQGISHSSDHNVVSLCLHSGPSDETNLHSRYPTKHCFWDCLIGNEHNGSWLGTGDAMLGISAIWSNFCYHYRNQTQKWHTVLMPHHGSGSGGNFNKKLCEGSIRYAVFSAGATNKYKHPTRSVLEAVADAQVSNVVVTEYSTPGFFEHLTYSINS